ncbi:hypothetical protein [Christiangramia sp. SM2212]|uniref:Lipoprotein n=1 Tax=Christiangramia sediminicola TaxID=3073267 RepID=A0ABU1EPI2_9FLAO|nr:hypothetical protein [Christiangramia sp. SM2212]MDR5589937.1 hypothetical protein [Christiangramia sp. SM2212]
MRQLITILTLSLLIMSCENKKKSSSSNETDLMEKSFSDYKELSVFKEYDKITDTSYAKDGSDSTHRITHIKRNEENIVLFNRIALDENYQEHYSIIDTLKINNLNSNTYISIGYCEMENSLPEEIIAILRRTDKDSIQEILKAWKANSESKKIEEIKDITKLTCLNEYYSGA